MKQRLIIDAKENCLESLIGRVTDQLGISIATRNDWNIFYSDFQSFFYDFPEDSLEIVIVGSKGLSDVVDEFIRFLRRSDLKDLFTGRYSILDKRL